MEKDLDQEILKRVKEYRANPSEEKLDEFARFFLCAQLDKAIEQIKKETK